MRTADVGIRDGIDHRRRPPRRRQAGRSTPTGWWSCPASSTRTRTTIRSSPSSRSAPRPATTASPRWSPATAATRSRPARPQDHAYLTALFAKVEGMTPSVLEQGLPWDWESFPSYLDALDSRLGINLAVLPRPLGAAPLRHGRGGLRARRDRRRAGAACSSWCARRCTPAPPGFSTLAVADARRSVQQAGAVAPRRLRGGARR